MCDSEALHGAAGINTIEKYIIYYLFIYLCIYIYTYILPF